jgi:hypothetical protein
MSQIKRLYASTLLSNLNLSQLQFQNVTRIRYPVPFASTVSTSQAETWHGSTPDP